MKTIYQIKKNIGIKRAVISGFLPFLIPTRLGSFFNPKKLREEECDGKGYKR